MSKTSKYDRRFEVGMTDDMRDGLENLAKLHGIDASSVVRFLIAMELTSKFGTSWIHDHPEGDLEKAS
jgi:hypothetical protein